MRGPRSASSLVVLLVGGLVITCASALGYLQVAPKRLAESIREADLIVQATVIGQESSWRTDEWGRHIYTTYRFSPSRIAKGQLSQPNLTLRVLGGQVGDIVEEVSPGWRFAHGDGLVLFLVTEGSGDLSVRTAVAVIGGSVWAEGHRLSVAAFLSSVEYVLADPAADFLALIAAATAQSNVASPPLRNEGFSRALRGAPDTGLQSSTTAPIATLPLRPQEVRHRTADGAPSSAATATISGTWWTNIVDQDGDAYASSVRLNWDPDVVGGGSLDVFEKIWYRLSGTGGWTLLTTTPAHLIAGVGPADSQFFDIIPSGPPGLYDLAIEIYQSGATSPDYVRDSSNDTLLGMVGLEGAAFDVLPPVITSITPSKASAGTDSPVTIVGGNFGSAQGTGGVEFFFQSGETTISAPVLSWSDTQIVCNVPTDPAHQLHDGRRYPSSAGSGPVQVRTAEGLMSNEYQFLVSFGDGDARWPGTAPVVGLYLGNSLPIGFATAIGSAAGSWSANAGINIVAAGTTDVSTVGQDGKNELIYGPLPPGQPATVIALADCWFASGVVSECDVLFNAAMQWSTAMPTPAGAMDVETISVHELGHWLRLLDLYGDADSENDSAKVMYGFGSTGPAGMKRSLHADDISGAQSIYGVAVSCAYTIAPVQAAFGPSGGSDSLGVSTTSGCSWTAVSDASWITITGGASGSGSGTVTYSVAANTGSARSGTMTVAGQTFTVNQDGASCSYSIYPQAMSMASAGGSGTVGVTTSAGCPWTAFSNVGWTTITSGASGSGSGIVSLNVAANTGSARSGTMTIAGQTFTVNQDGASCSYSINPQSMSMTSAGGSGTIGVTAPLGCGWTASSNTAWITVVAGPSGSGNGTVTYSVAANSSSARTGTITIAGQTFTVVQAAASCSYSITPSSWSVGATGGAGSFSVTAGVGCNWTVTTNVGWVHVTGATTGTGSGTVTFTVDANTGVARSGSLTLQGQVFSVQQAGAGGTCTYTLSPSATSAPANGGTASFAVAAPAACTWIALAPDDWLHILGSNTATGPGTVTFLADANPGAARTGSITILQGPTFVVTQAASYGGYAFTHWLPSVVHKDVPSRNAVWRSEVAVLNRAAIPNKVEVRLYWPGVVVSKSLTLAPNAQQILADAVKAVAGEMAIPDGSGALEVRSEEDVFLTGRTYNQVAPDQTYGQDYDGQEPDERLLAAGQSAWLPQLRQNALFRTNIGITNASQAPASVTLALYGGDGVQVWSSTRDVGPGEFYQFDQPFNAVGGTEQGYAKVTVNSGAGIMASASVIDQKTGDPTTINMKR